LELSVINLEVSIERHGRVARLLRELNMERVVKNLAVLEAFLIAIAEQKKRNLPKRPSHSNIQYSILNHPPAIMLAVFFGGNRG